MSDPTYRLLLQLAGRVDDDLLATGRELVAVGEEGHALELLVAELVAGRVTLPAKVRRDLVAEAAARRIQPDADLGLPRGDRAGGALPHRFTADGPADRTADLARALAEVAGPDGGWLLAWRVTPAGSAPGPLPHPVLLGRAADDGSAEVLTYQAQSALTRTGITASVEVHDDGDPDTTYHRAARAVALPLSGGAPVAAGSLAAGSPAAGDGDPLWSIRTAGTATAAAEASPPPRYLAGLGAAEPEWADQTGDAAPEPADHLGDTEPEPADPVGGTAPVPAARGGGIAFDTAEQVGDTAHESADQVGDTAPEPAAGVGETALEPVDQVSSAIYEATGQPGDTLYEPAERGGTPYPPAEQLHDTTEPAEPGSTIDGFPDQPGDAASESADHAGVASPEDRLDSAGTHGRDVGADLGPRRAPSSQRSVQGGAIPELPAHGGAVPGPTSDDGGAAALFEAEPPSVGTSHTGAFEPTGFGSDSGVDSVFNAEPDQVGTDRRSDPGPDPDPDPSPDPSPVPTSLPAPVPARVHTATDRQPDPGRQPGPGPEGTGTDVRPGEQPEPCRAGAGAPTAARTGPGRGTGPFARGRADAAGPSTTGTGPIPAVVPPPPAAGDTHPPGDLPASTGAGPAPGAGTFDAVVPVPDDHQVAPGDTASSPPTAEPVDPPHPAPRPSPPMRARRRATENWFDSHDHPGDDVPAPATDERPEAVAGTPSDDGSATGEGRPGGDLPHELEPDGLPGTEPPTPASGLPAAPGALPERPGDAERSAARDRRSGPAHSRNGAGSTAPAGRSDIPRNGAPVNGARAAVTPDDPAGEPVVPAAAEHDWLQDWTSGAWVGDLTPAVTPAREPGPLPATEGAEIDAPTPPPGMPIAQAPPVPASALPPTGPPGPRHLLLIEGAGEEEPVPGVPAEGAGEATQQTAAHSGPEPTGGLADRLSGTEHELLQRLHEELAARETGGEPTPRNGTARPDRS
ncbi:hypothetical protein [Pseudonocardia parietis]|uniref:Syndecan 1 n=1 Tax=Pseudonocardia parietis TaxID=570936 RepID=A0ABS4VM86_9PSEU|nr:hypothetical protein [Pseudonocardia parietis]MBP2365026.1 hypothetical protein [Pseudonocardia parietis]